MASLTITTRKTTTGPRYVVRFRLGGRAYPVEHGGSFRTLKDAKTRRDLIAGELAAGRNPKAVLTIAETTRVKTFRDWAAEYEPSRVDLAGETTRGFGSHLKAMSAFADRDPATVTAADVAAWIGGLGLKPGSTRVYLGTLRQVLDFAGVDPNPARDGRVRLPRQASTVVDPPTANEVERIVALVPARLRLPLRVLEQTGMRVGELSTLAWGDVDEGGSRFRVRAGKTAAARRWVAAPE
jgi:integrase